MKRVRTFLTITLLLTAFGGKAQLNKTDADNLVLNTIVNDTTKVVYSMSEAVGRGTSVFTANGEEMRNPYDSAYVYFIDDNPYANWAHPCRYCFLDITSNNHILTINNMYPENFSVFELISVVYNTTHVPWTGPEYHTTNQIEPDNHLWAVLICSYSDIGNNRCWGDLSCVYTALTNQYGFIENQSNDTLSYFNHIIVIAPDNVITNKPLDLNNSGGFSNNDFITKNYIYTANNDLIKCNKESIQLIFDNLAGLDSTLYSYGYKALDSLDKLFVYVTGHGHNNTNHSYIYTAKNEILYDYELSNMVKNINCSQITFLLQPCYSGGFVDDLSDTIGVKCKNRVVHSASLNNQVSYAEAYINNLPTIYWPPRDSDDDYYQVAEFTYYWCAALLGYYPIIRMDQTPIIGPWNAFENNRIGCFPWNTFFNESELLNHFAYDVSPDINNDGVVSMNEAFIFARKLDSWDTLGYYNPRIPLSVEYPQSFNESTFTKELITLNGYKGIINNDVATSSNTTYLLDGGISINHNASLTIHNNCHIKANKPNICISNYGVLCTQADFDTMSFSNISLTNMHAERFEISNCVFDTCGIVETYDGPFSVTNCTFNETHITARTNNPPRNTYSVDIIGSSFNNSTLSHAISIENVPQCQVRNNTITSGGDGIIVKWLSGPYSNHVFSQNIIENCNGAGFISYGSNAKLINNKIQSNDGIGLKSLNLSNLYVTGNRAALYMDGTQNFWANGKYQIYATKDSYPMDFRYNVLHCEGTNDTILYYETSGSVPTYVDATRNCWYPLYDGQISSHLYTEGIGVINYLPIWMPNNMPIPDEPPQRMLAMGNEQVENGEFNDAVETYMQLVEEYPESPEAIAALKELFSVEITTDGDFYDLKEYYLDIIDDNHLGNASDNLANRCDVKIGNYTEAIEWYEGKINDTTASYSERVFAEIDLGDMYLQMEDNGNKVHGKMKEYIPASKELHTKRTEYLLSQLPGNMKHNEQVIENYAIKNPINKQFTCSPNPANEKTTLSFKLDNDTNVDIRILNMYGNEVKRFVLSRLNSGSHNIETDVSDIPDGIYLFNVTTDNGYKTTLKIIVKH